MVARHAGGEAKASPLSPAEREELRVRLVSLRARAEAAVTRTQGELKGEDAQLFRDLGPTGDWAVAEAEFERDMAGAAQARDVLALVKAAEQRMHSGDYGSCEDCGAAIGYARLSASPAAIRCVACQGARERPGRGSLSR
ncbi:MAG: TraR/DksA family transcriptional regulator [Betaproteobacteria bacterium]|nr:TraR/DksA family transcriptional regulator [Betaproteobacteria bacterium]